MNDRARALAVLREMQEILTRRLTDRVLDSREELLEDAEGQSYSGEIEAVYEQIALRLNHVNVMLANLPAPADESSTPATTPTTANAAPPLEGKPRPQPGVFQADTATSASSIDIAGLAETAELLPPVVEPAPPVNFETFVRLIAAGDLAGGGRWLATLFDADERIGLAAAAHFQERWAASPDVPLKTLQLRRELQAGANNAALALLGDCFGLRGLPAIAALQTLRARLHPRGN